MASKRRKKHPAGPGRPKMNGHGRSKITAFRLSEEDAALFARAAREAGETLSTFLCTAGRERAHRLLDP